MNTLHAALTAVWSVAMRPFAGLPPWVGLVFWSLAFGVLAAIAFRYTSNQRALRRVADQVRANLLAMRLFKDDLWVTFRAQGALLKASGLRLLYSLPPMLVMLVPFVFLAAQLAMYYQCRPLRPGETAYVDVLVNPQFWEQVQAVPLQAPAGIAVEAAVRDPLNHMITWRLRAERPVGPVTIAWDLGPAGRVEKQLVARQDAHRISFVSPVRAGPSLTDRLLYPGEPAFDRGAPIQRIEVRYPPRSTPILGFEVHWIITLVVVSILGAFAAKPFIRVQF